MKPNTTEHHCKTPSEHSKHRNFVFSHPRFDEVQVRLAQPTFRLHLSADAADKCNAADVPNKPHLTCDSLRGHDARESHPLRDQACAPQRLFQHAPDCVHRHCVADELTDRRLMPTSSQGTSSLVKPWSLMSSAGVVWRPLVEIHGPPTPPRVRVMVLASLTP